MTTPEGDFETMLAVIQSIDTQNLDHKFGGVEFQGIEGVHDERAEVEVACNKSLSIHLKNLAKTDKRFDEMVGKMVLKERPDSSGNVRFNRICSNILSNAGKFEKK